MWARDSSNCLHFCNLPYHGFVITGGGGGGAELIVVIAHFHPGFEVGHIARDTI